MKIFLTLLCCLCSSFWSLTASASCEQYDFGSPVTQYYIYSDGRTWDFTADHDMTVATIETVSRLAGTGTYALTIKVLINGEQKASWSQSVTTTYTNYTHSQDVIFDLNIGDTITYKISGGTLSKPGGAITGPNYVKLCDRTCEEPTITTFNGTPRSIQPGDEATLNWLITGAETASINQGIGSVNPASGSIKVSPASSIIYTLTASNFCGSNTATATIQVNDPNKPSSTLLGIYHLLLSNRTKDFNNNYIYTASDTDSYIERHNIQRNSSIFLNINGIQNPYGITVDQNNKKIYWTDYGVNKIFRANLDGSNIEVIISNGLVYPCGIAIDEKNNKIYWTDWGNSTIKRSNIDGTNIEILLNNSQIISPVGIALDIENEFFYFADEDSFKIQRANLDGTNLVDIATNLPKPHGIVYSQEQQKLFWTNWIASNGSVQSCNLDGSNIVNIVTGLDWGLGITIDTSKNRIYYSHEGEIRSCNYDGSDDQLAFNTTHVPFIVFVQE